MTKRDVPIGEEDSDDIVFGVWSVVDAICVSVWPADSTVVMICWVSAYYCL